MAPTGHKMTSKTFNAKTGNKNMLRNNAQGVKKKRKWVPGNRLFEGSVKEGQGFAFKRKERVRHEYNRLLRKEKRRNTESTLQYKDEYPEHLKHLYLAEAEKLKQEAWTNRVNRAKLRVKGQEEGKETAESDSVADVAQHPEDGGQHPEDGGQEPNLTGGSELSVSVTGTSDLTAPPDTEILPMSNRMKKKLQKKTSYQKTKEEFEKIKEKRMKKKEEYLERKQQREEAIQKYKQKKMETFQMLNKKTKKGQPNLNVQMDYLLQKIQGNQK